MTEDKDKFSRLIEEKLNDFQVPYNEAHWEEMSQKLDAANIVPKTSSLSKWIWGGVAAVAIVGAFYFLTESNDENNLESGNQIQTDVQSDTKNNDLQTELNEASAHKEEVSKEPVFAQEELNSANETRANESDDVQDGVKLESKLDKYADLNEIKVKEESKEFVEDAVAKEISEIPADPKIDNSELRTEINVLSSKLCANTEIKFAPNREIEGAKYYWNFGDNGLTSRKVNPEHTFRKAGTYTVTVLVSKGEKNNYKAEQTVTIETVPEGEIMISEKQITLEDPYIEMTAKINCTCDVDWNFNEESSARGKEVSFLVPDRGTYPISMIVVNESGCRSRIEESYRADKGVRMSVENAFTPNNRGGNEEFMPKELKISNVSFTLTVMDNTGRIVFESNDSYKAWNGKLNNSGTDLPSGTYLWKVSFTDNRGKVHSQNGTITLIR